MNNCSNRCECKLTGIIFNKKPLISQMNSEKDLQGELNLRVKKVKETISFAPYVKDEILYFRTQAEVDEDKEELTIYNE